MKNHKDNKIMVAMSGGVDSSVSALICREAAPTTCGATMKLFDSNLLKEGSKSDCCSIDDIDDAKSVCHKLGIEHYTLNCKREFKDFVVNPFVESYLAGQTPNPCISCNRHLKFDTLIRKARATGFDAIATGHYARIENIKGRLLLKRGVDERKDQSYVLHTLTKEQLQHVYFPIGSLQKNIVRDIATKYDLCTARKKESQDICFLQNEKIEDFIKRFTSPDGAKPNLKFDRSGVFVNTQGEVLGNFDDYSHFTIGQRKGLNLALGQPCYVSDIDVKNKKITIGDKQSLLRSKIFASDFNWISICTKIGETIFCTAKIRYNMKDVPCKAKVEDEKKVSVVFADGVSAPAKGQSITLYDGDVVLGGGYIYESI